VGGREKQGAAPCCLELPTHLIESAGRQRDGQRGQRGQEGEAVAKAEGRKTLGKRPTRRISGKQVSMWEVSRGDRALLCRCTKPSYC
jgi:hypothetical protein